MGRLRMGTLARWGGLRPRRVLQHWGADLHESHTTGARHVRTSTGRSGMPGPAIVRRTAVQHHITRHIPLPFISIVYICLLRSSFPSADELSRSDLASSVAVVLLSPPRLSAPSHFARSGVCAVIHKRWGLVQGISLLHRPSPLARECSVFLCAL